MAADEAASASDLARIIEQDPGLATRLLKLVNSAFYARGREISSIPQAVVILGFKKLRMMALTLSLRDTFPLGKVSGMDYDYFWKTSLYRALIAQGFVCSSPLLRDIRPEEAFTAGLILEIGMLMLYHICPESLKETFPGGDVPLEEAIRWEEGHFGINHRDIGQIALKRWQIPKQVIECQKYFGTDALKEERSDLCRVLEFARTSTHIFFGQRDDFAFIEETAPALGLDTDKVNEILSETFSRVQNIAGQLRLKVNSDGDILAVMEKANQALAKINGSLETNLGKMLGLVSDYEQLETEEATKIVKERKKVLEDLLDAVAHEIRNPLMVIGGFARRMGKNLGEKESLLRYANIIAQESTRLEMILNEISALSQEYEPSMGESNLIHALDKAIDSLQGLLAQKNIEVLRDYTWNPPLLDVDQEAISKAFRQILETIIQSVERTNGKIWISLQPLPATNEVKIVIGSKGFNLPEEVQQMLRGLDFSSRAFGLGLRLVLARKILEAHDGHIKLETEDEISHFVIQLPVPPDATLRSR
jgi:HD-like signal output (HDOD) protein